MSKKRLTVTLEAHLVAAAQKAVQAGTADSVSAYVSEAMSHLVDRRKRLQSLTELVADYESAHGVITDDELAEQEQVDRDAAASVRATVRKAG